jgi:hypothetical protein
MDSNSRGPFEERRKEVVSSVHSQIKLSENDLEAILAQDTTPKSKKDRFKFSKKRNYQEFEDD